MSSRLPSTVYIQGMLAGVGVEDFKLMTILIVQLFMGHFIVAKSNNGLNEWCFVVGGRGAEGRWFSVLALVSLNQIFVLIQN